MRTRAPPRRSAAREVHERGGTARHGARKIFLRRILDVHMAVRASHAGNAARRRSQTARRAGMAARRHRSSRNSSDQRVPATRDAAVARSRRLAACARRGIRTTGCRRVDVAARPRRPPPVAARTDSLATRTRAWAPTMKLRPVGRRVDTPWWRACTTDAGPAPARRSRAARRRHRAGAALERCAARVALARSAAATGSARTFRWLSSRSRHAPCAARARARARKAAVERPPW